MHNSDKTFQFDVHPQCEEMRSSPKSPVRVVLTRKYNMQVVVVKIEASGYYWCYDVNNDLEDEVWNVAGQGCWQSTASENMPLTQGHVQIAGIPAMEGSNTVRKFDPRAPSTVQMGYHPATGEAYDNSDFSHRSNHFQAHANRYDDTSCIVNPRKSWCYFMQKNPIFCVITCLVAAAFTLLFEGIVSVSTALLYAPPSLCFPFFFSPLSLSLHRLSFSQVSSSAQATHYTTKLLVLLSSLLFRW